MPEKSRTEYHREYNKRPEVIARNAAKPKVKRVVTPEQKARYNAKQRERYAANPEKWKPLTEKRKALRAARDPDLLASEAKWAKTYRSKDPEKFNADAAARAKQWRKNNPERAKEIERASTKRRAAKRSAYNKQWRLDHPIEYRALALSRRERHNELCRKRRADNPEAFRGKNAQYGATRRALKAAVVIDAKGIKEYMRENSIKPSFVCYLCESEFPTQFLEFDHVMPLSRGGAHSIENLACSCITCNRSKGDKTLEEYREYRKTFPLRLPE